MCVGSLFYFGGANFAELFEILTRLSGLLNFRILGWEEQSRLREFSSRYVARFMLHLYISRAYYDRDKYNRQRRVYAAGRINGI